MNQIVKDILLILLFIVVGGVFAAAEMALISLRESQVKQLSTKGKRGQTVAALTADPNRFLSAVQIGVTLAGFLSAAYGGATLSVQPGRDPDRLGRRSECGERPRAGPDHRRDLLLLDRAR